MPRELANKPASLVKVIRTDELENEVFTEYENITKQYDQECETNVTSGPQI